MKNQTTDNFESFIRDKAKQYMVYPTDEVWNRIDSNLRPKKYLAPLFIFLFMISISSGLIVMNVREEKQAPAKTGQIAYAFIEKDPIETKYPKSQSLKKIHISNPEGRISTITKLNTESHAKVLGSGNDNQLIIDAFTKSDKIELPVGILTKLSNKYIDLQPSVNPLKKNLFSSTIETVIAKAKIIGKNAQWQFYITPTLSFRRLNGVATSYAYQYTGFPYSTNSLFARDVNDAVKQHPGVGLEFGTAMHYPISKKLSLRTGLQFNYNKYQIEAYSGVPVLATYGMNNYGFGGSIPINTVSIYSNTEGYRKTNLKNEHIVLSIPIGLEYVVAGNSKINLSVASSIQPSYLIGNNAYLISTNLKNYAKEPSLNRRWNVNTSVEASVNFQSGSYKWSIAPQYRYQLISSFKNKYPIKENLFDMGLKLGVIKTIR